ncbi:MAG: fumarylacetoacetate hydrolase family protein [Muribaculaceae bacterium]|nr:fumarylacetoacetate hydrolase family protein [Muribaculaceae bacterium]
MKIIGIGRELPEQVYLMADSAIIKTNKPFFVPHFAQSFTGTPAIVLHIDRLGKHIAPRFAHRYCLALAPAIKVTARELAMEQPMEATSALSLSFDGALLLGDFTTIDIPESINSSEVTIERNGERAAQGNLNAMGLDFRQLIAQLSVYFTLKMGDMIVVELGHSDIELKMGDTLHAAINGCQKLTIRVK